MYRGSVDRKKFKAYQALNRERQGPARVVQRMTRVLLAKQSMYAMRWRGRLAAEAAVAARGNFLHCRREMRDHLLIDSAYGGWKYKGGELQGVFSHWSSSNDHRLSSTDFVRLCKDTPGVVSPQFNSNDLELVFERCKALGQKHIEFDRFMQALDLVSASLFHTVTKYHGFRGKKARMLMLCLEHFFKPKWGKDVKAALEKRTDAHVASIATRVQRLRRGNVGRAEYRVRLEEFRNGVQTARLKEAAVLTQALVRRYRARGVAVARAKSVYIKCVKERGAAACCARVLSLVLFRLRLY